MNLGKANRLILGAMLASALSAQSIGTENVLIRSRKPYTNLIRTIQANGGTVTQEFKYVDAIAAQIPRAALAAISVQVGPGAITKDLIVPAPAAVDDLRLRPGLARTGDEHGITADSADVLGAADIQAIASATPNAYLLNNAINRASALHAGGVAGQGVIVAVIDSGIRPGFPHISLDGSVIGCEDFVGDALGCSNSANNGHGTFVAGMISANVIFAFSTASGFRNAVLAECPACFANPPINTQIPMIGTAPLSSIYALRVFPPTGGSPNSRIFAAMERTIELREKFNMGLPGDRKIDVLNMSLGGPALFPGQEIYDTLTAALYSKGIVPVISAGNAGPSSLTVGSPGSAVTPVTVGAASQAHNERILRRLQMGPVGSLFRPFLGTQTAFFSSRGPNADGRGDPDVTANGFANYGQGLGATPGTISLASGTSFSAPSVAGVAALLRQAFPGSSAAQIRNAIVMSANPALLADGSTMLDQGYGYVNAWAARNLLAGGAVPNTLPAAPNANKSVKVNIETGTSLIVRDGAFSQDFSWLKPGQRHDILYRVLPNTAQVVVNISNFRASLPPAQQNQLFGDDILLAIHSAKTSAIGEGDYPFLGLVTGGTFTVNNPETGVMRITVNGDWTNAGDVSGRVAVFSTFDPIPGLTSQARIVQGQGVVIPVNVPAGTGSATFRLHWREDWGNYPTNDLDLILISPSGAPNFDGASLNNPEWVTIANPAAGIWTAFIQGFEVNSGDDKYELRATLDGKVVR